MNVLKVFHQINPHAANIEEVGIEKNKHKLALKIPVCHFILTKHDPRQFLLSKLPYESAA